LLCANCHFERSIHGACLGENVAETSGCEMHEGSKTGGGEQRRQPTLSPEVEDPFAHRDPRRWDEGEPKVLEALPQPRSSRWGWLCRRV
jgi:hypothetical protein